MFKIHDTKAHIDAENQRPETSSKGSSRRALAYLLDVFIIAVMGVLMFWGASTGFSNQYNDVHRYQCYAVAFWHGTPGLSSLPHEQCAFLQDSSSTTIAQKLQKGKFPAFLVDLVKSQSTTQPLHALPPEYPLLTIVPFSVILAVPQDWYQTAFAILMALMAGVIYFVLKRYRSTWAAIAFAVYLVLGNWGTAEARFDLIPAGLTLGAVILAARARWKWAYALLALATMLKFYTIVLIVPFFIAQQMQFSGKWNSWRRLNGVGVFVGICAVLTVLSLVLNVADTISPLRYFVARPIQVESLPANFLWLASLVGHPIRYVFTFQSLNFDNSSLSSKVSLLSTACLVIGLLYTFWLQLRGKLDIYTASLLTLLVVMITGKVFSPQYLIWIAPLVAYVGQANWKWLVGWSVVGILTTIIYPFLYVDFAYIEKYYQIILVRDAILLVITLVLLYYAGRFGLLTEARPKQVEAEAGVSHRDNA